MDPAEIRLIRLVVSPFLHFSIAKGGTKKITGPLVFSKDLSNETTFSPIHLAEPVLRIRIRIRIQIQRIHMFLGLLDPNPDPSIIKQI
jgi:hypothetical protein